MTLRTRVRQVARRVSRHRPALKAALVNAETGAGILHHTVAERIPAVVRPRTRKITVAVTAACNLRCVGCRYGRDFMNGSELPLPVVGGLLEDASEAGIDTVRLYGGEPLLHRDLPRMVERAVDLGLSVYVTTNGVLLDRSMEDLFRAGLRSVTVGFYGTDAAYDAYVQRSGRFSRLERSLDSVRQRFGDEVGLQLNLLVMRPTCDLESLEAAWRIVERYDMTLHTDLIHYSLPYFTEGPHRELAFRPEDRGRVERYVQRLLELKTAYPDRIPESHASLRSIPDWIELGPDMRVPCDAYKLIWVGADGTVKLCYVTFVLGNLHEKRLRDILYGEAHSRAARDAFLLRCPNCHCERDSRIRKHLPSRALYSRPSDP